MYAFRAIARLAFEFDVLLSKCYIDKTNLVALSIGKDDDSLNHSAQKK